MSDQAYVVMPVKADGAQQQDPAEVASAIQQSLHEKLHPEEYQEPEPEDGPLKKVIAQQDSLYKYINWEDPVRTFGSYMGLLVLLCGAHYLQLTQWALKLGATGLGVVSLVSFVSRSTNSHFLDRLQPEEYKQVPESSLNATLKDIHDLVQYAVVQAQRIIYGKDLDKTFYAFISLTTLYWLNQIVSPFGLAVLGLSTVYVAPLVTSPRGREVAHDAKLRAQDIASATTENAKALAKDGKTKAQETAADAQQRLRNAANSGKQTVSDVYNQASATANSGKQTATDLYNQASHVGKQTVSDLSNEAIRTANKGKATAADLYNQASSAGKQTASDLSNQASRTANSGKATAADLYNQASDTTNNIKGAAAENMQKIPDFGNDATNKTSNMARSTLDNSKQYVNNSRVGTDGRHSGNDGRHSGTDTDGQRRDTSIREGGTKAYPNVTVH